MTIPIIPFNNAPWVSDALCVQIGDPESWFPEAGTNTGPAKRICRHCPVQAECLDHALANNELFGIWGGYTTHERLRMRRRLRSAS